MNNGVIQGFFPNGVVRIAAPQRGGLPNAGAILLPPNLDPTARGGSGAPLSVAVRQRMESVFGRSFADVRIHIGAHTQSIGALAFTSGNHIHFAPGQYDPATARGERLLAHELAHVVQQHSRQARNPFPAGMAIVQDQRLEAEADRMALRIAAQPTPRAAAPVAVQRKAAAGCSGVAAQKPAKSACGLKTLPPQIATRIRMLAGGSDPLESMRRFSSALPGLMAQMKALGRDCGCGCGGAGGGKAKDAVVQRAQCNRGDGQTEWYTRTGAQVRANMLLHHGMDISSDIAHVLCCAFCEAFLRSWAQGGAAVGLAGRFRRFTALFEHYVHQYDAHYVPGAGRQIYTEEAYWVPANGIACGGALGLAAADAYLLDAAFVGAVRVFVNATIGGVLGGVGYPTGMPVLLQLAFDNLRAPLLAEVNAAPPAIAAGGLRRSYPSAPIRLSRLYNLLRLVSAYAPTALGTQWDVLRAIRGRMRVLDFAAVSAAGNPAVADAKFSYMGGRPPDDWGPGQAADQATIYSTMPNAVAATIPVVTFQVCGCNQGLLKQMIFDAWKLQQAKNKGKRTEATLNASNAKRRRDATSDAKFINSATVKYVKR
ncbi:MAG TPA: DUF4157 domain-containing protein [Thermoanaerobaculia bacterium]|nr:DUF4157 domain-containing protein [Thermoanaerobaculia bacterium]